MFFISENPEFTVNIPYGAFDKKIFYPQDVDGLFHGENRDFHTTYYGEIISAYIVQ